MAKTNFAAVVQAETEDVALLTDAAIRHTVFLLPTIVTLLIYISTASNSIAGGDAGELVAEGCKLGTAHPPGYPLYTLIVGAVVRLAQHFSLNDVGFGGGASATTPVYWVNVTSCIFGAMSTGLISSTVFRLTNDAKNDGSHETLSMLLARASCAVSASITCALSPLMWQYNKEAEVFALHNWFVSAILYTLTVYGDVIASPKNRAAIKAGFSSDECDWSIVIGGSFLCGLSLTNQHTSILLILPVAIYVFYQSSILQRPKLLMSSVTAFLVGLSPYVALPIMAAFRPHAGSWGDVTSVSGFFHHLLRRDYGTLQLFSGDDSGSEGMILRISIWFNDFTSVQLSRPWFVGFLMLGVLRQITNSVFETQTRDFRKGISHKKKAKQTKLHRQYNPLPANGAERVMLFSLLFYLGVFHSMSNLPLSNPLLFGIHQVRVALSRLQLLVQIVEPLQY
jgi:hypothetical protein